VKQGCIFVDQVLLTNKYGEIRVPVDVTPSEVSRVSVQTVNVPGETIQRTSTMVVGSDELGKLFIYCRFFKTTVKHSRFSLLLILSGTMMLTAKNVRKSFELKITLLKRKTQEKVTFVS